MSALLFDDRPALGNAAGLHALIVGVGSYPYLRDGARAVADHWDMTQLSSTASSAYKVYEWLRRAHDEGRLSVPLATCRVLLSPTPGEGHMAGIGLPATLANLGPTAQAWREDCKTQRDNVAFFYFAGHGVQRTTEDAVLCLEEFRQPGFADLFHAVSLANIRGGMAPAPNFDEIARTQLYFADACRVRPESFSKFEEMNTTDVFKVSLAGRDDRCSPIFYSAISNQAASAVPGRQTLFSRGILECLDGEAGDVVGQTDTGEAQWGVTVGSLNEQLDLVKIDQLNRDFQADQTYAPGGQFRPSTICTLKQPPPVSFRIEVVPPEACQYGRMTFIQPTGAVHEAAPPIAPNPYEHELPGGIYRLVITFDPPHPPFQRAEQFYDLRPVRLSRKIKVG